MMQAKMDRTEHICSWTLSSRERMTLGQTRNHSPRGRSQHRRHPADTQKYFPLHRKTSKASLGVARIRHQSNIYILLNSSRVENRRSLLHISSSQCLFG